MIKLFKHNRRVWVRKWNLNSPSPLLPNEVTSFNSFVYIFPAFFTLYTPICCKAHPSNMYYIILWMGSKVLPWPMWSIPEYLSNLTSAILLCFNYPSLAVSWATLICYVLGPLCLLFLPLSKSFPQIITQLSLFNQCSNFISFD